MKSIYEQITQDETVLVAWTVANTKHEVFEAAYLAFYDEIHWEEKAERLRRNMRVAKTADERDLIAHQLAIIGGNDAEGRTVAEDRSKLAQAELREFYPPFGAALVALLDAALVVGEKVKSDAEQDEAALFEKWGEKPTRTLITVKMENTLKVLRHFRTNEQSRLTNAGSLMLTGSTSNLALDWFKRSTLTPEPAQPVTAPAIVSKPTPAALPAAPLNPPFIPSMTDEELPPPLPLPAPVIPPAPAHDATNPNEEWH